MARVGVGTVERETQGDPRILAEKQVAGPIYWDRVYRSADRYRQRGHSFVV